jgi:hypothetical protein
MANRLAGEGSPYLLQHASNPVDWYPWGEEAFARAREDDKPIFLSVGYSTCHWCHVMAHESFERDDVAERLNADFVPVKVDREERPDVDRVYMSFVQATSGGGGWPMSVWLTPDLKPFYGGTYFPPTSRWGRPGFLDVLAEVARVWRDERERVRSAADEIVARLSDAIGAQPVNRSSTVAGPDALDVGAAQFRGAFDARHGGFGGAPKFPRPSELLFLLRQYARSGEADLLAMVAATLQGMSLHGMRDHVGGGFHRYAVDAAWRVPHFEKMLYDQAQITLALLETAQATGDRTWRVVAEDTLAYVRRELTHPEGAFYSAEDADSVPPDPGGAARPAEGAFYLWRADDVERFLGSDAEVVKLRYGIEPGGNAPHDPHGEFGTGNILYTARSIDEVARAIGREASEVADALARSRGAMLEARRRRPRPHLDAKILAAWNGLMIAAFARAARVLDRGDDPIERQAAVQALDSARRAAGFLRARSWDEASGTLLRSHRDGRSVVEGFAEDYACLVFGLLELFQATGDAGWLEWAMTLQARQDALFWDSEGGGWFNTTGRDSSVLFRLKEDYDGAEPSPSAVGALNLLTLAHLVGPGDRLGQVAQVLGRVGQRPGGQARAMPMLMAALAAWHAGGTQVVIVGEPASPDTAALRQVAARRYLPFAVVVPVAPGEPQRRLATLMPWIGAMRARDGRATAYVCHDFACDEPAASPEALDARLDAVSRAARR